MEGTFDGTNLEGDTTGVVILNCRREADWVGTVVGRIGFLAIVARKPAPFRTIA